MFLSLPPPCPRVAVGGKRQGSVAGTGLRGGGGCLRAGFCWVFFGLFGVFFFYFFSLFSRALALRSLKVSRRRNESVRGCAVELDERFQPGLAAASPGHCSRDGPRASRGGSGATAGFVWSFPPPPPPPRGADLGAVLPALMAKPLAQPCCGGAPRRTNASRGSAEPGSAVGESGAAAGCWERCGHRTDGAGADSPCGAVCAFPARLSGSSYSLCAPPSFQVLAFLSRL